VEKIKQKKIKDNHDADGVVVQGVDDSTTLLKTNLNLYQTQIQTSQNRIEEISNQRGIINTSIERVKSLKEGKKSNKEIRKLNQNIYTSRQQLKELTAEEQRLTAKQSELMGRIATIQKEINTQANKKGELLHDMDNKMSKDQFDRLIFLFVLVIFIEITSFGGLLADFLGNKNLEADLKAQLDHLNNNTDTMSVLRSHLTAAEVRQARDFDRELTIRGTISDVHALSSIASMHRLAQNTKGFAQATHQIGEATNEVTQMAVEGIASSIRANLANQRVEKLQQLLVNHEKKDE
jgi:chromosome segregation ATPase